MDWKKILKAATISVFILVIMPGFFFLLFLSSAFKWGFLSPLISFLYALFSLLAMFAPLPLVLLAILSLYLGIKKYKLNLESAALATLIVIPFFVLEIAFLFWLGEGPGPNLSQCTFPAGFSCVTNKLYANTGKLYLEIGQGTVHKINVTGVACTQNISFATRGNIIYGGNNGITIDSGTKAAVSDPNDTTKPWMNISCTDAKGQLISNPAIGEIYNGRIYINYTELDTNTTKVITGSVSAKFES
jgi:hypothetical protein